jgi:glycolate oxidase iron-sulfur subunit
VRATWDDPCHLAHGQGVRGEPRALLARFPGFELVEMRDAEQCCGSAGIYALARPADSAAVLAPKLDALRETGAELLVTANPGCQIQWAGGLRRAGLAVRVAHIAEVLDEALSTARTGSAR